MRIEVLLLTAACLIGWAYYRILNRNAADQAPTEAAYQAPLPLPAQPNPRNIAAMPSLPPPAHKLKFQVTQHSSGVNKRPNPKPPGRAPLATSDAPANIQRSPSTKEERLAQLSARQSKERKEFLAEIGASPEQIQLIENVELSYIQQKYQIQLSAKNKKMALRLSKVARKQRDRAAKSILGDQMFDSYKVKLNEQKRDYGDAMASSN